MFGREDGDAPPVDLAAERRNGEFILAQRALIRAAATCRMAGWRWRRSRWPRRRAWASCWTWQAPATLFGEDQARYLVACRNEDAARLVAAGAEAGVPVQVVGRFGGAEVTLG